MNNRDINLIAEIKWMIALSICIHFICIGWIVFLSKQSREGKIIIPSYTVVDLIHLPPEKKRKKKILTKKKRKKSSPKKKSPAKKKTRKKKKPMVATKPVQKEKEDELLKQLEELEKKWTNEEHQLLEKQKKIAQKRIKEEERLSEKLKALKEKWSEEEEQLTLKKRIAPSDQSSPVKLDSPDFSSHYLRIIIDSINENWKQPFIQQVYRGVKSVLIAFKIGRNGDITDAFIEVSSGSSELDRAALQAVTDTTHLPPLPSDFLENYLGVHFRFDYFYSEK